MLENQQKRIQKDSTLSDDDLKLFASVSLLLQRVSVATTALTFFALAEKLSLKHVHIASTHWRLNFLKQQSPLFERKKFVCRAITV